MQAHDREENRFCCRHGSGCFGVFDDDLSDSNRLFGVLSDNNSEPAEKAKTYLRNNEKLKQDVGEVQNFGNIVTAAINDRNGNSEVTLKLKVIGEKKTVNATVDLMLVQGNSWRVTSASYVNSNGQSVKLLDPYETKVLIPSLTA